MIIKGTYVHWKMFVNAFYNYVAFLGKNYFNRDWFKFFCFINCQVRANFIRMFIYNKARPAVASVGVYSIEWFGRLILLLGNSVFEISDSVIPMKSNSSFISSKNHSKLLKCLCKELTFKCNIDRHLDFILLLRVEKFSYLYILNLANHYSHLFHHL